MHNVRIGDVVQFQRGVSWSADQEHREPGPGRVPVLRIPNVQENLTTNDLVYLSGIADSVRERTAASKGWILAVGSNGNPDRIGNAVIIEDESDFLFASFLVGIKCDSRQVLGRYLLRLLHSDEIRSHLRVAMRGSTGLQNINLPALGDFRVKLPSLPVQRRIVEMLDAVDAQIGVARALLSKRQQQADGLLDGLVSNISDAQIKPLSELCVADICYGIVQSGEFVAGGVPVLSIRDISGDFETDLHRTHPAIDARYRRSRVISGDVLLSIKGTIGRVGVAPTHFVGNVSRELARLRFGNQVLPEFARLYFLSREAQRRLDLAVVGTTRAEVSIHVLKRFSFPVPSLARQEHVIKVYRSIERQVLSERQCLAKLLTMRSGLREDLVTGRVRIPAEAAS
ncbi:restriction endonuclease subunit S [Streptomyces avidinii]|uniref:restriction endonuclease subunit S n=1 Tax=Streptomyces avidinii TaxID=1895 RepID=UPI0038679C3C|nr:restriction endonuclease subunit S [Streptomyces avidinii]